MHQETGDIREYLKCTEVTDYNHNLIVKTCDMLKNQNFDEIELIKKVYEFVRDEVKHSSDIGAEKVTCKASDVLYYKHGICVAKSNLLAAMLRYFNIPTGFCYQLLSSNNDINVKVIHGLNAVFIKECNRWIRLDARGNKPGVNAQFSITEEKIARPVRKELGEIDIDIIFADPVPKVIEVLEKSKSREELMGYWKSELNDVFGSLTIPAKYNP